METSEFTRSVPFDTAMSMAGYGLFNILILLAAGGGLMCTINETMCMMFITPAAQCDLNLSLSEKSLLSSVNFFGVLVSSYMWGYLADTRGRKMVLTVSLTISSISTLICSIIPWTWLFILLRFINGFFIGGAYSVIYVYAGEFQDNQYRPKIITWMSIFVAIGNMYLPGLAWLVLPQEWLFDLPVLDIAFRPWRLLLIIYTIPCLLCGLFIYYLPESPKFLMSQGHNKKALEVLKKMYTINTKNDEDSYAVDQIIWEDLNTIVVRKEDGIFRHIWNQTTPLFKGELLPTTLMICYMQFGIIASSIGIFMWYPEILNLMSHYISEQPDSDVTLCTAILYDEANFSSNITDSQPKICQDEVKTEVFLITLIVGAAHGFTYLFIGCVITLVGKKPLIIAVLTVTTIGGVATQFVYGYELIQILLGIFLMSTTAIGITNAIAVDLFPTEVRGMALAVGLIFGRLGGMVGTGIVGPLIYHFCDYLFYFVVADHIVLIIVILLLPSKIRQ